MRIAVGLASGLGNAVFMLPTIKALKILGHRVALFVQTDFPTTDLWRRCVYADEVHEISESVGDAKIAYGQWIPAAWRSRADLRAAPRFQIVYPYVMSESESNLRLAKHFGFVGEMPDVHEWCRKVDRSQRWDIGFIPGCKGGTWIRKRYPGMAAVAGHFKDQGMRIAVFGLEGDGAESIPGEWVDTRDISKMPDALAGCRLIVGTDSGAAHLASSLGVPVLMLFSATSHVKGRPIGPHVVMRRELRCSPCQSTTMWRACSDWSCQNISPADVILAAEKMMEGIR